MERRILAETIENNALMEKLIEDALAANLSLSTVAGLGNFNIRKAWKDVYQYRPIEKEFALMAFAPGMEEVYESAWSLEFTPKSEECIAAKYTQEAESVDRVKIIFNFTEFKGYTMVNVTFTKGAGYSYSDYDAPFFVWNYYSGSGEITEAYSDENSITVEMDLGEEDLDEDNLLTYPQEIVSDYIILDQEYGSTRFMEEFLKMKLNSLFNDYNGEFWFTYDRVNEKYRLVNGEQLASKPLGILSFVLEHTITKPDSINLDRLKTGLDLADTEISLEDSIRHHLTGNFSPSIPSNMVQPCVDAINACNDGDSEAMVKLPKNVYRGKNFAPAYVIVEAHQLEPWLTNTKGD